MSKTKKNNTLLKITIMACMFAVCVSCGFLSDEKKADIMSNNNTSKITTKKANQEQETIDDYTDNYTITPNYELPKFKELVAEFNKQEHRFEIDACAYKYNGESFFIGDSVDKIKAIFGEPEEVITETLNKVAFYFKYKSLGISMRFSSKKKALVVFNLNLWDVNDNHLVPFDIIKFREIPYHYKMKLNDYLELSDLDHTKLRHSGSSFVIRQQECAPSNDSRIANYILSQPIFKTKGRGHLTFTGDFDPSESKVINGFEFFAQTIEDINN